MGIIRDNSYYTPKDPVVWWLVSQSVQLEYSMVGCYLQDKASYIVVGGVGDYRCAVWRPVRESQLQHKASTTLHGLPYQSALLKKFEGMLRLSLPAIVFVKAPSFDCWRDEAGWAYWGVEATQVNIKACPDCFIISLANRLELDRKASWNQSIIVLFSSKGVQRIGSCLFISTV